MIKSKALEVNIADYHVDVDVDPKYFPLQDVMSKYYGMMDSFNTFLKELSHPYRNWHFIVKEARNYSLNYFHQLRSHPRGDAAAQLFGDIFLAAIAAAKEHEVRVDAADNLLLLLQKMVIDTGAQFEKFEPVVNGLFDRIREHPQETFFLFVKSYYSIRTLVKLLVDRAPRDSAGLRSAKLLLARYLRDTYRYWLSEEDPLSWMLREAGENAAPEMFREIFAEISPARLRNWQNRLPTENAADEQDERHALQEMLDLPGFSEIVQKYREIPAKLLALGGEKKGSQWKLLFLFYIIKTAGLSMVHGETLRDINRILGGLIYYERTWNITRLIEKTFVILKIRMDCFPDTALSCVLNMAKGVYNTGESELINFFIDRVIDLGFQSPMIQGVGDDWQIKVNSAHIRNIRTWLEIIELNPKGSVKLLSSLIIHLSLVGVFIKDTDLFPRDITRLCNSSIEPVYNLVKQLARLFPVYFNDIGAEGRLRDISTQLDEITHRKDLLVHFLRKQSHVESNNRIVNLIEAVLCFWNTRDKQHLRPYVPPSIFDQIDTVGPWIDGVNTVMARIRAAGTKIPDGLRKLSEPAQQALFDGLDAVEPKDCRRVNLAVSLYRLLYQKYTFDDVELRSHIAQFKTGGLPELDRLEKALDEPHLKKKIYMLLGCLKGLKAVILSDTHYEPQEDIYKKRHITVDIPSMYGSYREMKFDALGLTFRIEALVNMLFEQLVNDLDLSIITKATFYQIFARLRLFNEALQVEGLTSNEMGRQMDLLAHSLEVKGFTFTQYVDIFKGFAQAVKNIINDYFNNIHEKNLSRIFANIPLDQLLPKYLPSEGPVEADKLKHRASEIFFRDQIAFSLGLQQLDQFITRTLNTLFYQSAKLPKDKLHLLLLYDPKSAMTAIAHSDNRVATLINLGNKGYNMVMLKSFGLPVPQGFIITTEVFRCRKIIDNYFPASQNFKEQLARQVRALEKRTGKNFGRTEEPLLFSVRSGATISQPGMMDTFLNVGINVDIAEGIAADTGNPWFAWDNYRRFLQCYGMSYGIERDEFDALMKNFKQMVGIPLKQGFTGNQMKQLALTYRRMILDSGIQIIDDPFEQLYMVIKRVMNSWESPKAKAYRKIMGISDDWGTAVTVQQMVFGNLSSESGTGVIFTHNPRWSTEAIRLWGDFSTGNQGEDVVSGLVHTMPISLTQQDFEMRDTDRTLETEFPDIFNELNRWAKELIEKRGWSPQEMEFTFEGPHKENLFVLQTRDMAMRERKDALQFDFSQATDVRILGHGIGVSGGAQGGRIVFSLADIDEWRIQEPDTPLILLRSDTVPEDIREIYAADGLLTARGGMTSHAAIVAHRLGKTCVVGCGNMICSEKEKECTINQVVLRPGDFISIDGQEGTVYQGLINVCSKE